MIGWSAAAYKFAVENENQIDMSFANSRAHRAYYSRARKLDFANGWLRKTENDVVVTSEESLIHIDAKKFVCLIRVKRPICL